MKNNFLDKAMKNKIKRRVNKSGIFKKLNMNENFFAVRMR